jgi:curli production assembly/transport component CsgG
MANTINRLTPIALAVLLTGCGTIGNTVRSFDDPVIVKPTLKNEAKLKEPATGAIAVAVYNFRDMTGQRKAAQNIASLSSAVTQGADAYLVKSLQEVGEGRWFKVLERGGLDNLIKERQLIRQMRELYQGDKAQPLPPMMFAGIILEGGIIGYDSNTMSGGSGARLLGIGASSQYQQDEVTVSIRAVSVATGEVLVVVNANKKVFSFMDKAGVLRFYDAGTQSLELETGSATNESMNKAVQLAIHAAVIELINDGARKGHWSFKAEVAEKPADRPQAVNPVVVKPEEKRDELVQKDSAPKAAEPPAAPQPKPDEPKVDGAKAAEPRAEQPAVPAPVKEEPRVDVSVPQKQASTGVIKDWVYIRKEKYKAKETLAKLKPGIEVEVIEQEQWFVRVRFNEKEGWIPSQFIKVQK